MLVVIKTMERLVFKLFSIESSKIRCQTKQASRPKDSVFSFAKRERPHTSTMARRFALFSLLASVVQANLLHIPGVSKTREAEIAAKAAAQNLAKPDPNEELYYVCSEAEDDEEEHVLEPLEDGANINWVSPIEGITCLFSAVMRGKLQVVETVLDHGADVTLVRKEDGLTPLHAAAFYGRTLILKAFRKRGLLTNVNETLQDSVPLLHRACQGFSVHHKNAISYLVEQGADLQRQDADGKTCWDKAVHDNVRIHIESLGGRTGHQHEEL